MDYGDGCGVAPYLPIYYVFARNGGAKQSQAIREIALLRSPSRKHWSKPMTALCLWFRRLGLQIPSEQFVMM